MGAMAFPSFHTTLGHMKAHLRFLKPVATALGLLAFVGGAVAQDAPPSPVPETAPEGPDPRAAPEGPVPDSARGDAPAGDAALDAMFEELKTADERAAARLERQIWAEWSKSGSAAMDLLLQRGRDAMAEGDTEAAIDHFSALIDHDPGFAEGWNGRATAFFQAGMYGESVSDIAQVLRLNPRHFGALAGFARILEDTDRPAEALAVYRAAIAIDPHLRGVEDAIDRLQADAAGRQL